MSRLAGSLGTWRKDERSDRHVRAGVKEQEPLEPELLKQLGGIGYVMPTPVF